MIERDGKRGEEREREYTTATRRHTPKSSNFLRKCATCAECGLPLSLAHSTFCSLSASLFLPFFLSLSHLVRLQEVLIESILRCRLCHVANFAIAPKCMLQFCATKKDMRHNLQYSVMWHVAGRCLVAHGTLHASSQV